MGRIDDMVWCDGCGVEIPLAPVKCKGYEFCCQECADGLPCECGIFWFDDEDYEREAPVRGQAAKRLTTGGARI